MIYRFDSFDLDTDAQELRRDGLVQPVEPQVFALLVHLVANRERVVSRDDILEAIWRGRIVSEAALSSRVKAARQAIGDDGQSQRLIRTVHKRGFRFVGTVDVAEREPTPGSLAATVLSHEAVLAQREPILASRLQPSIAVLPFRAIGDSSLLAEGLTHDLITRLGRTRWLFVIARGSAFRFIDSPEGPEAIAGKLGVRYIAHGTVQAAGRHLRMHAILTDATAGQEVWSEQYDRRRDDLFTVQSEICDAIAGEVESQIEFLERGRSLLKPSENLDAWEAYHRGCWHMYKFRSAHFEEAERCFQRSIALDGSSPRPFSGLSFVHWQRAFLEINSDRAGEIAHARDLAEEAIARDPRDPQGYHALGRAYLLAGDVQGSVRELQRAVDLNPSFSFGHYSHARSLYFAGSVEESHEAAVRAERLSPFDPLRFCMLSMQATSLTHLQAFDEAEDLIARSVEDSNAHHHILALAAFIFAAAGKARQSRDYLARLRALHPDYDTETYLRAFPFTREQDIRTARGIFG